MRHLVTLGIVLLVAAVSLWVKQIDGVRSRQGAQAHKALCVLERDFEQRVQDGEDFLVSHPHGIPGIPAATIRNSIANQEKTVEALIASGLTCN